MTRREMNQQCTLVLPFLERTAKVNARAFNVDYEELYGYGLERLAYLANRWKPGGKPFLKYVWAYLALQVWKKACALQNQEIEERKLREGLEADPPVEIDDPEEMAMRVQAAWGVIINALPTREGWIISHYYGVYAKPDKQIDIAEYLNVTPEYVRQLRVRAENRLKRWKRAGKFADELELLCRFGLDS